MKNLLFPFFYAACTAIFWGLYGPILGKARAIEGSPFKPYVAIGIAYLVIAIFGGAVGMWWKGDSFSFSGAGATWGLVAGTLGALGALTLTLAMFTGGSAIPQAIMPVVFGGAVAVTAGYTIYSSGGRFQASPMLWVGVVGMLASIVIITMNTPHAAPPTPPGASQAQAPHATTSDSTPKH